MSEQLKTAVRDLEELHPYAINALVGRLGKLDHIERIAAMLEITERVLKLCKRADLVRNALQAAEYNPWDHANGS